MIRQVCALLISNVHLLWYLLAAASWLVKLFPQLDFVAKHGKLSNKSGKSKSGLNKRSTKHRSKSPPSRPSPSSVGGVLSALNVPKSWFAHLYIIGTLMTLCTLWQYHSAAPKIEIFTLWLFLLHCTRRLLECWYVSNFGQSRVHVSGYLVGIFHYLLVPVSLLSSADGGGTQVPESPSLSLSLSLSLHLLSRLTAVFAFLSANYFQHKYHKILRSSKFIHGAKQYVFPQGGLFDYVCCPHYTCEICIYVCFFCLVSQKSTFALLVWVVSNLSVVAQVNLTWYKERFPAEAGLLRDWKCCIPFVY
jgi:3-oxo-5-alpha-steroid 4-dehydrogenase 3 / polyprenol reductase